jgi:hypothetical protein
MLVYMKVSNPQGIPSPKIVYKVFKVDSKGEETYFRSFEQNIQNGWDSSWQPDRFPTPGVYMVRLYNDSQLELCHKKFELRKDW